MLYENKIWVGSGQQAAFLLPAMANRHGLIAGATGTGKTVSLKVLAEGFSAMGVPVFVSDIKGDLSGMVRPGEHSDKVAARLGQCGVPSFQYRTFPTVFWDIYGIEGHPIRATISEMGPVLLSRMLNLNDIQTGVMNILFRVADDEGMLLLDIKDLKAMLTYVGEHAKDYTIQYGNVSAASIGAIQRAIAVLESQGGDVFFGEPSLNIADWMQQDEAGHGFINIMASDKLFLSPVMYATFMLWMLSELYEILPEQGDSDKPRMVFFFDEAHLLFADCSKALLEKIEQVVRLIRSKGVGVYFITQSPADIPMSILGQLGNRIQHALRAYTPLDQKAVKVAAQTFRPNPAFSTEETITQLKTGEALVSFLDEHGAPGVVDRVTILPPQSYMGAIDSSLRKTVIETSPLYGLYEEPYDRESAYEILIGNLQKTPIMPQPITPVAPEMVQVSTAPQPLVKPQGFMVFDPTTGGYVQKELPQMSVPTRSQPAPTPVPTIQVQQAVSPVQMMPVMIYDAASGQYVQQMMAVQQDPATGNFVPAPQQAPIPTMQSRPQTAIQAEKERKAAEKAQRDAEAAQRRARADELREERAARARKNDSVIGRVTNSAISTVSREVTRTITRGVMGGISSLFGGNKKR